MESPPLQSTFGAPSRLHIGSLVFRFLKVIPYILLSLFPLFISDGDRGARINLLFALAAGVITIPWILASYFRFSFQITPDEVIIDSGVFTRKHRSIPLERIQNVAVERSFLQRILGIAQVNLDTAGSVGSEAVLQCVGVGVAHDIRQLIRSYQQERGLAFDSTPSLESDDAPDVLYSMSFRDVVLAGSFRFSLLYIAISFSLLQQLQINPEEIVEWLSGQSVDRIYDAVGLPTWVIIGVLLLLAFVLSWITSMVVTILRYFRYQMWIDEKKVHKKHGLLTLSEGTVPLDKVQVLKMRSNLAMRRWNWFEVSIQNMGVDARRKGSQVVAPLIKYPDGLALAQEMYPHDFPDTFLNVSPISIRRSCIRYTVALLALLGPLSYFATSAWWGLTLLPLLYWIAVLQYRHHTYGVTEDSLVVRRGFFQHRIWIVPIVRMQVLFHTANWFQRRLGLATVHVDTAGSDFRARPFIEDLPAGVAGALVSRLYARLQREYDVGEEAVSGLLSVLDPVPEFHPTNADENLSEL